MLKKIIKIFSIIHFSMAFSLPPGLEGVDPELWRNLEDQVATHTKKFIKLAESHKDPTNLKPIQDAMDKFKNEIKKNTKKALKKAQTPEKICKKFLKEADIFYKATFILKPEHTDLETISIGLKLLPITYIIALHICITKQVAYPITSAGKLADIANTLVNIQRANKEANDTNQIKPVRINLKQLDENVVEIQFIGMPKLIDCIKHYANLLARMQEPSDDLALFYDGIEIAIHQLQDISSYGLDNLDPDTRAQEEPNETQEVETNPEALSINYLHQSEPTKSVLEIKEEFLENVKKWVINQTNLEGIIAEAEAQKKKAEVELKTLVELKINKQAFVSDQEFENQQAAYLCRLQIWLFWMFCKDEYKNCALILHCISLILAEELAYESYKLELTDFLVNHNDKALIEKIKYKIHIIHTSALSLYVGIMELNSPGKTQRESIRRAEKHLKQTSIEMPKRKSLKYSNDLFRKIIENLLKCLNFMLVHGISGRIDNFRWIRECIELTGKIFKSNKNQNLWKSLYKELRDLNTRQSTIDKKVDLKEALQKIHASPNGKLGQVKIGKIPYEDLESQHAKLTILNGEQEQEQELVHKMHKKENNLFLGLFINLCIEIIDQEFQRFRREKSNNPNKDYIHLAVNALINASQVIKTQFSQDQMAFPKFNKLKEHTFQLVKNLYDLTHSIIKLLQKNLDLKHKKTY